MQRYYDVYDVMKALKIGKRKAYQIILNVNTKLLSQGFIIIHGKIPKWKLPNSSLNSGGAL